MSSSLDQLHLPSFLKTSGLKLLPEDIIVSPCEHFKVGVGGVDTAAGDDSTSTLDCWHRVSIKKMRISGLKVGWNVIYPLFAEHGLLEFLPNCEVLKSKFKLMKLEMKPLISDSDTDFKQGHPR